MGTSPRNSACFLLRSHTNHSLLPFSYSNAPRYLDRYLGCLVAPTRCSFAGMVWPQKNGLVEEWEVVLYAFIILKAVLPILLPLIASRKRALDGPKGINWSDYRNVTNRFGIVPGWWEDIALALSYHPVTCKYTHLHSSAGLNSWFAKCLRQCFKRTES